MRIGIVCHASIGGSGLVATELGIALAKLGHQVHFIAKERPFKLPIGGNNLFFHGVEAIDYPLFNDPLYVFALTAKIAEVVETHQLDLVHVHYSIPHSLCAHLAGEITDHVAPVITTLHGTDATVVGLDKRLFKLNQFSIQQSDLVTTVSHHHGRQISEYFALNTPVEVIHNFIDLEQFSPSKASLAVRRTLAGDDEKILMHISNFRAPKNSKGVIYAFAKVCAVVRARLVLLGSGPEIEPLKALCQRLDISEQVSFMGDVQHVEELIASADCVMQPSYHESFGMVILEAMASGVPTVSSDVGGMPEVVEAERSGFLSGPDDHEGLAAAVIKIFQDPLLQQRVGRNGRRRAEQEFATDRQVDRYLECYQKTLDRWHQRKPDSLPVAEAH